MGINKITYNVDRFLSGAYNKLCPDIKERHINHFNSPVVKTVRL